MEFLFCSFHDHHGVQFDDDDDCDVMTLYYTKRNTWKHMVFS